MIDLGNQSGFSREQAGRSRIWSGNLRKHGKGSVSRKPRSTADLVRTYGTLQPQVWRDTRTRGKCMESSKWALGDSVVVKPGVTDPVTGSALGGWQGRLIALEDQRDRLSIQWDSLTLKSMPPRFFSPLRNGACPGQLCG